ncbi:hypothetical protein QBC46DRAFT_321098 [Diplogelasinospora grovesii]|uniref:Polyketide synthase n=1 Tax=Diplogelasinospora grovesii TaxID=303347 RepID=A0AAN6N2J4_9PEZI|nr:hypothetical protein QBC46DRAFT_321098 [Diplogelasinospora grovesii]
MSPSRPLNEPIAIIGSGCRFPGGSSSASKLWELLKDPRDVSSQISESGRFNIDRFYHPESSHNGTTNSQRGYLLSENVRHFDAKFFSMPPGEAEAVDPQQRILLEVVYEAVESAGLTINGLSGSDTACYVGIMCQDFFTMQSQDNLSVPKYAVTGIAASNASSRVSYFFDWHGPSMTIDTACSSSMVCVNEAVQALRNGTSRVAVACGTNLLLSPFMFLSLSKVGMVSPTGRSHMWDERADGYARGEGVGAVVLKTLSAAIQDGDNIACVIREVGLNHDGKTKGLTMPSAEAQAALIRETYRRAGLDPTTKSGRCQFFEAHGTGTPTGDPREAEALDRAFFPKHDAAEGELLVGSIKTVIGHTEGCAGIAGILKACLALQHSIIPPNLLFNRLNPALEPFVKHLRIPTACEPWPEVPRGQPRRASINSFGFGGANAHCIIESYEPDSWNAVPIANGTDDPPPACACIPFVFSATSVKSLVSQVESMCDFLDEHPEIDLPSLAYTLSTKRSALSLRLPIHATSAKKLRERGNEKTKASEDNTSHSVAALAAPPSVLGIFTGQGAQWLGMGSKLVATSPMVRNILGSFDAALASLPSYHRPSWTFAELLSPDSKHGVNEAVISQPICTAVQIVLVKLLRAAGVKFRAVVGHSSGEIAAAYTAGFLNASDAIRIAYYRGYFAKLAAGPAGEAGGMIAAGTDFDDADELCGVDDMVGRLCVAAHNSPTSITLSGDVEAVSLAEDVFVDEKKFARKLRVDTAYHSIHMQRCAGPYLKAMHEVCIQPLQPGHDAPAWFSSVHEGKLMTATDVMGSLNGQYWVDNMVRPVLFYPAIKACLASVPQGFNFALEVGPHPALQGPVKECIQAISGQEMAYSGTLKRGSDDVEAFADALGSVWARFGPAHIDLGAFQKTCQPDIKVRPVFGLPTYPWSHEAEYWAESRRTKIFTTQPGVWHDLLGLPEPDGLTDEMRWRNTLNINDLKWLAGHTIQGEVVFPATGYICMISEAALQMAHGQQIAWIDMHGFEIRKAIAVHRDLGAEVLFSLTKVSRDTMNNAMTADFSIFSTARGMTQMGLNCRGSVRVTLGTEYTSRFPARGPQLPSLVTVDVEKFYQVMRDEVGLESEGAFKGLTSISRRTGYSSVTAKNPGFSATETQLLFHPAMLDCALQGLNAAFAAPGDGSLYDVVAPTYFERITLVPELLRQNTTDEVAVDSTVTDFSLTGDVDVYSSDNTKLIEMEGVKISPLAPPTAEQDRFLFQESILCLNDLDSQVARGDYRLTEQEKVTAYDAERLAFYYFKQLYLTTSPEVRATLPRYRQCLLDEAERFYHMVKNGEHPFALPEWVEDTKEYITALIDGHDEKDIDIHVTATVGENLLVPEVLSGEVNILQFMMKNNMLERIYIDSVGWQILNEVGTGLVAQLCQKYPRMNMLEIGAGTGGSTATILSRIGDAYTSYTYTDISSAFFERADERFRSHAHKMMFKTLDITKDPAAQGFTPQSYDVIVAQNVLHATAPLRESLKNARRLLRPGGYFIIMELTRSVAMHFQFVEGSLPGWWVGEDDGRKHGPLLTAVEWEVILAEAGFTVDTVSDQLDQEDVWAVISARVVDEKMAPLVNPLDAGASEGKGRLMVIGGKEGEPSILRGHATDVLAPYFGDVSYVDSMASLDPEAEVPDGLHVLLLTELDANLWQDIQEPVFNNLKRVLGKAASVLWLLQDCMDKNPHAGSTLGFLRTVYYELPDTKIQTLDIGSDPSKVSPTVVAECLLRLREMSDMAARDDLARVLWGVEPELYLKEDGRLYVSRMRLNDDSNARYNSAKRVITCAVQASQSTAPLALTWDHNKGSYILREQHEFSWAADDNGSLVTVKVSCSFLSSLKTPAGFFFVCLGTDTKTGVKTLCFSDQQASVVTVPRSWAIPLEGGTALEDVAFMSFAVADLLAQRVLQLLPPRGSVVIFDANPVASALLLKRITDAGKNALLLTSKQDTDNSHGSAVYLHPHSPKRAIDAALPLDVTLYIDASDSSSSASEGLGARIAASLSPVCEKIKLSSQTGREASSLPETAPESIAALLQSVASFATVFSQLGVIPIAGGAPLDVLPLPQLLSLPSHAVPKQNSLVYWQVDHPVPVSVEPVYTRKDLFRSDRTYWLAGLSGTLGRSLADFLISNNARHIAISSRSPKIDQDWVDWHKKKGVSVLHFSGDVTNYEAVKQTYADIRQSMPPIDGVAVGAMVLIDATFMTQRYEDFQAIVRPKVQGTINLDRLFSGDSDAPERLDWFIGFSSLVGVTGNPGQSAYGAGNCFLKALIRDRHNNRGLAGSSIDIGRMVGVGYIERALAPEVQERLKLRSSTMSMSETDLHQLFAEAVVAGRPRSGLDPELIAGVSVLRGQQVEKAFWAKNARLGMMIKDELGAAGGPSGNTAGGGVPVRKLLEAAKTVKDANKIIVGALRTRLMVAKFLPDSDTLHDTTPLVDLGVDSLIAVDMRSWFQKELAVDVPVMKILGGASMVDLVEGVMEKLPGEILGRLDGGPKKTPESDVPAKQGEPVKEEIFTKVDVKEQVNGAEIDGIVDNIAAVSGQANGEVNGEVSGHINGENQIKEALTKHDPEEEVKS